MSDRRSVQAVADASEADRIAGIVARHLAPSLVPVFDARFARSNALFDEFVYRLSHRVLGEAGLASALGDWGSAEEVASRAGLDLHRAAVPVSWLLRHLSRRGVLARRESAVGPLFRAETTAPLPDPAPVVDEQREHDRGCLASYALAEMVAGQYSVFLRGGLTGEEILFAPTRLPLWVGYFSNDNILYAVSNRVGAAAVEAWMPARGATILELGGGLASGAAALFERLSAVGRLDALEAYRFSELVPAFLRRGQRTLQERFPDAPLTFTTLDMNRPFAEQGIEPGSLSMVYAVNTVHVARDLAFTLAEIGRVLEPGGQVIVSECVRPWPGDTLYPEFVFNLLETFRSPHLHAAYRPNGGFLTPEQWVLALQAGGFWNPRIFPDVTRIRDEWPGFYVAAIGASRPI